MSDPNTQTQCPLCAGEFALPQGAEIGELLDCGECGEELEVISVSPPKLKQAPEEEEDWGE
ncbi:lysine biosynthesis protein LysW [bacterium]|nr:lysine biosynthesis protein LysW [bacterium]